MQPCPEGTDGTATWTCGYDSWIGKSPDFSSCTTLNLSNYTSQLNDTNNAPSDVITDINNDLNDLGEEDKELSSGDIIGLVDFIGDAVNVSTEPWSDLQGTLLNILSFRYVCFPYSN